MPNHEHKEEEAERSHTSTQLMPDKKPHLMYNITMAATTILCLKVVIAGTR
jgi:hypothetical protein